MVLPLQTLEKQKDYDITIVVKGGGLAGQVDAIKLAISKALVLEAPDLRPVLKKAGMMSIMNWHAAMNPLA